MLVRSVKTPDMKSGEISVYLGMLRHMQFNSFVSMQDMTTFCNHYVHKMFVYHVDDITRFPKRGHLNYVDNTPKMFMFTN
jgi:hypothetical protein